MLNFEILIEQIHAPDAATSTSSSASRRPQPHTTNLSTPDQFPSGTNLTKKPPKRLPSTASRVVCTSSPSPFVDLIPHIGSLSTTFQIQIQIQNWGRLSLRLKIVYASYYSMAYKSDVVFRWNFVLHFKKGVFIRLSSSVLPLFGWIINEPATTGWIFSHLATLFNIIINPHNARAIYFPTLQRSQLIGSRLTFWQT